MPFMNCPPGAGMWTRDGTSYQDDGSGRIWVEAAHVTEAVAAGWRLATDKSVIDVDPGHVHVEPDESPQSAAVLDEPQHVGLVLGPKTEDVGEGVEGTDVHTTSELTVEESPSSRRSTRGKL